MEEVKIERDEYGNLFITAEEKKRLITSDEFSRLDNEVDELRWSRPALTKSVSFDGQKYMVFAYLFIFVGFIAVSQALRRSL